MIVLADIVVMDQQCGRPPHLAHRRTVTARLAAAHARKEWTDPPRLQREGHQNPLDAGPAAVLESFASSRASRLAVYEEDMGNSWG